MPAAAPAISISASGPARLAGRAFLLAVCGAYLRYAPVRRGKGRLMRILQRFAPLTGTATIRTKFGAWMQLDLSQYLQQRIFFEGIYDEDALDMLTSIAASQPKDVFVDVGANVGHHALYAAVALGFRHVYAFEPHPSICAALKRNVALNVLGATIQPFQLALSDRAERLGIETPVAWNNGTTYMVRGGKETSLSAEAVPLTEMANRLGIQKIDLLKVDVEGAAIEVLSGAAGLLSRGLVACAVVELKDRHLARFGHSAADVLTCMRDFDYDAFYVRGGRLRPLDSSAFPGPKRDAFFFPRASGLRAR